MLESVVVRMDHAAQVRYVGNRGKGAAAVKPVVQIDVGKPQSVIGDGHALHALLYGNLSSQLMNSSLILPTMCCVPAR